MDKETYVKRVAELAEIKQKALEYNKRERNKVMESYLEKNCPFKAGERVTYKGKPGTLFAVRADSTGKFEYDFRPDKKDGTPSCRVTTVYEWSEYKIEKA